MPDFSTSTATPASVEADLLILPLFDGPVAGPGVKEVGKALGVDLVATAKEHGHNGKAGRTMSIPTMGKIPARNVLLLGVGTKADADLDTVRRAAGKAASAASGFATVATTIQQVARGTVADAVQAAVEGALLGAYRFDRYKTSDGKAKKRESDKLASVVFLGRADARAARNGIERGRILAESTAIARDLVNTPSGDLTPEVMATTARKIAKEVGLKIKVYSDAELERGRFGGIIGVGKGSAHPPRLIELTYQGAAASRKPIGLVGKGITFDSGGLSIKDAKNMEAMKMDKAGASSMLAAMRAIALLKPKVNVVAALACAENMPSGSAQRPGDVIHHRNGKTSEVLNTDAEGRLVMADALALLVEKGARPIVDAATLTGACIVALGDQITGVMGNDPATVKAVLKAGEEAGEPGWELPLWEGYNAQIESNVADIKNIGSRGGGTITAALFLQNFVDDTPWVHLDVAGTAWTDSGNAMGPKGATGNPVRTVVRFVLNQASSLGRSRTRSR